MDIKKEKRKRLKQEGTLHPQPNKVTADLISQSDFFDPEDLMQMKYEMLRKVSMNAEAVTDAANSFGLSRFAFYHAQQQYRDNGLAGLLPSKRGPKRPHKLTQEVMTFIDEQLKIMSGGTDWEEISRKIQERFKLKIHPRSIMRAVKNKKKGK